MNKRIVGSHYEELACRYLEERGFRIAARNFRSRSGEIDIIGYHDNFLVFVEVKYRTTKRSGNPEEAVGPAKQKRICRTADYYRFLHRYPENKPVRYDVIGMEGVEEDIQVRWYKNAFAHVSGKYF
ncbi:YraN family protein [Kineothrix sp. MB12-C1]|uniref:YraN family protein n=1 Tax=Kineothrix sp. MB12-C1 TaxID=3070215 RepID=UPI0027D31BBF|nr:YraN family protein [Kineothrix sp. MB12-C1]WMC92669.1 YraN family protein [Kineothrix sp. MB12-C1]